MMALLMKIKNGSAKTTMKMNDPYQVVPGLWIGSKQDDLARERKKLMSRMLDGDVKAKQRIFDITNELIEMRMPRPFKASKEK